MTSLSRFVFVNTPSCASKKSKHSSRKQDVSHDFRIYSPSPCEAPSQCTLENKGRYVYSPSLHERKPSIDSWSTSSCSSHRSGTRSLSPPSSVTSTPTSRQPSPAPCSSPPRHSTPLYHYETPVVNDTYDSFLGVYHATVDRMQSTRVRRR